MLSKSNIDDAKTACTFINESYHEHDDCIQIAYEWLDAQIKIKSPRKRISPLKHVIEKWGGRYVSKSDVEIAAYLHPDITGKYPRYNISERLVEPSICRLEGIVEAFSQPNYREDYDSKCYKIKEGE